MTPVVDSHPIVKVEEQTNPRIKKRISRLFYAEAYGLDSLDFEQKIVEEFDSSGVLIDKKIYAIDSNILYTHFYRIEEADTVFEITREIQNAYKPSVRYDSSCFVNGLLVKRDISASYRRDEFGKPYQTGKKNYSIFNYNEDQRLTKQEAVYDGKPKSSYFEYNKEGLLVKRRIEPVNVENIIYTESFFYNDQKLLNYKEEVTIKDGKDTMAFYQRYYKYNVDDSLVYESWYRGGKNFSINHYAFDARGNKIEQITYDDTEGDTSLVTFQARYTYNVEDWLTQETILNVNHEILRLTLYKHNEYGDVIEKIDYSNVIDLDKRIVQCRRIESREIEYYD